MSENGGVRPDGGERSIVDTIDCDESHTYKHGRRRGPPIVPVVTVETSREDIGVIRAFPLDSKGNGEPSYGPVRGVGPSRA